MLPGSAQTLSDFSDAGASALACVAANAATSRLKAKTDFMLQILPGVTAFDSGRRTKFQPRE
jgi:hypothetical protein